MATTLLANPVTAVGAAMAAPVSGFRPQHVTSPASVSAQVWLLPPVSCVAPLSPATVTGVVRSVDVPSPSFLKAFSPQHLAVPSCNTAQECAPPVVI